MYCTMQTPCWKYLEAKQAHKMDKHEKWCNTELESMLNVYLSHDQQKGEVTWSSEIWVLYHHFSIVETASFWIFCITYLLTLAENRATSCGRNCAWGSHSGTLLYICVNKNKGKGHFQPRMLNPCYPEGFSQTYFPKGGCCNPLGLSILKVI